MKNVMRRLYTIGLLIILIMTVTACTKKTDSDKNTNENSKDNVSTKENIQSEEQEDTTTVDGGLFQELVVTVGKEKVLYSEAMIYFKYIQAQYESNFGNKIWTYDFGEQNFGDMAKQEIINMISQTKIIGTQVEKNHIVLTDEEEVLIKQNAETFLAGLTVKDKEQYGLTEEAAQMFYRDNLLYEKVFDVTTMKVNTDVSDNEAKQIKVQHLLVLTTEKDKDGKSIPLSKEKKAEAYAKVKELLKGAKKTDDFLAFAEANTDDSSVEYTFGTGEMDKEFEKVAFELKSGELSNIVETTYGYHIIYCVSDYDEDATLEKKEEIIEVRQDDAFQALYEKWSIDYKIKINDKVWDAIEFTKLSEEELLSEPTDTPTQD